MKLSPAAFLRQLHTQETLPTVVALVGEESYYRNKVRQALLKAAFADTPEEAWTLTEFAENTDFRALDEALNTYPFFSGHSVVLLRDEKLLNPKSKAGAAAGSEAATSVAEPPATAGAKGGKKRAKKPQDPHDKLLALAAQVPEFCTLIVECAKLDGRGKLAKQMQKNVAYVDCAPIKKGQLDAWFRELATARGARFEQAALDTLQLYLMNVDNPPLSLLEQEVDKLALYAAPRTVWTQADVEQVFAALPEIGRFALTNAVAERRLRTVLDLLAQEERQKTYILMLTGSIASELRRLLMCKEYQRLRRPMQQAQAELGLHPYVVQTSWSRAAKFDEDKLREGLLAVDRISTDISLGGRGYDKLQEVLVRLLG